MTERLPEGTVTILFTDVVGSTALAATVGDRAARERIRAREQLAREQLGRHSGLEIKGTGDGMMAAFRSARQAVDCAVAIQRAIERLNLAQPQHPVQLRIGVHTGEVFPERGDLHGSTVNAAARIEAAADAGGIMVSETVKALLGPGTDHRLSDRGEHELKGFDAPWRLFSVGWQQRGAQSAPRKTPLVDRERERETLAAWLDEAQSGRGTVGLLGGEPGVGKSRLAAEAIDQAQARGFLSLTGHCYELEGAPPYNPFVEMIDGAVPVLDQDALSSILGEDAPQAAKIAPRLRAVFPDMPEPPARPPEVERQFLLESMRAIVARMAARQPVLLMFDDLQWMDASTFILFQHLVRSSAERPLLMLGTYRDTEAFPGQPLAQALAELSRLERVAALHVQRLPHEAVSDMLRAYGGADAPRSLVDLIIGETEGNPFFVEQVLKHLSEAGRLFDTEGHWRSDVTVREDEVPRGVRAVIERRLERIAPEAREVLASAAIIGRVFSFELLTQLAGATDESLLLDAIDAAEHAALVGTEVIGGESRPAFAHELIRQTLLGDLSLPRRQRLHLRAADAIEAAAGGDAERHAADVAHHLYAAGPAADPERTARCLMMAGKQALAASAFEDARRSFDAALERAPSAARQLRSEVLYQRGVAAFSVGRWDQAEPDWSAALALAEQSGAAELAGRIGLDFGWQLAFARRPTEVADVLGRALAALGTAVSGIRARVLANAGLVGADLGLHGYETAHAQLDEAVRIAEAADDRVALGHALGARAHLFWRYNLMPESAVEYAQACEILERVDGLYPLAEARAWHVLALIAIGDFAAAERRSEGLEAYCERMGNPGALFAARRARAYMDLPRTGNLAAWNAFAEADLALLESLGSAWTANSHAAIALGRFWDGRWNEALPHARRALELTRDDSWVGADAVPSFLLHAYCGDRDAVQRLLEQERAHLPVIGCTNMSGRWELLPAVVEALATIGADDEAGYLYPVACEAIATGTLIHYVSKTLPETTAGIAASCSRQWDLAETHFEKALRQADELPNRLEQPEVRRWLATMLLDRGTPSDRARACELLAEANDLYEDIGMPRHRARAAMLLASARASV